MLTCNDCVCQKVCVFEKLMYEFAEKICERLGLEMESPLIDDLSTLRELLAESCVTYQGKPEKKDP